MANSTEVIRAAREVNPGIRVLARAMYLRDLPDLKHAGADTVFTGEGEVALAFVEDLISRLGATAEQIDRERARAHEELFGESRDRKWPEFSNFTAVSISGRRRSTCKQENNRGQGHLEGRHPNRGGSVRRRPGAHPGRWRDVLARLRADAAAREGAGVDSSPCITTIAAAAAIVATAASYDVQREIEDLDAVLQHAGGSAMVFGISSGAALAGEAVRQLRGIRRLALYEAPYVIDGTHEPLPPNFIAETKAFVASGDRSAAVKKFMRYVGTPAIAVFVMSLLPFWKKLTAIAHTLLERSRNHRAASQRQAVPGRQVVDGDAAGPGDGGRQEPGIHAELDESVGRRRFRTPSTRPSPVRRTWSSRTSWRLS